MMILTEKSAGEAAEAGGDRRREGRKAVLKRAQVVFGGAAMDCVVEDLSARGAKVRSGNPVALPEMVTLRFPEGGSYAVVRRWARGAAAGVEFVGTGPAAEAERRHMAAAVKGAVEALDPADAVRLLDRVWFFGDERVRRAAEALQLAQARFAAAVAPHLAERGSPLGSPKARAA